MESNMEDDGIRLSYNNNGPFQVHLTFIFPRRPRVAFFVSIERRKLQKIFTYTSSV